MRVMCAAIVTLLCFTNSFSTPSDLKAEFRKGKTFITFTEDSGAQSYNIYRSENEIAHVHGLAPLANIPKGSSYDSRYGFYHVVEDLGQPLSANTGLFVYTPKQDNSAYYAITSVTNGSEDTNIISGTNSLVSPEDEEYWQWPCGVLRSKYNSNTYYFYYYWMDYFDWPHAYEYYGDHFVVGEAVILRGKQDVPLELYLHGAGSTLYDTSNPGLKNDRLTMRLQNHCNLPYHLCQSWWYGVSNHYSEHELQHGDTIVGYDEMRIVYYTQSLKNDPRFSIDTNRIYLSGGSMGGFGTYHTSFHNPDIWAAIRPNIAARGFHSWYHSVWYDFYGPESLNLTARNGVNIYNWMDETWIAEQNIGRDFPPIVNSHGSTDGISNMRMHRCLYRKFAGTRHGIWGKWFNLSHDNSILSDTVLSGGYMRFRKNELYPVFSNASQDDDYGQFDPDTSDLVFTGTPALQCDSAGLMNGYIDWTSSLHDMGLSNDDLIDCADSISITMRSSRPNTVVDVTPRRVQDFIIRGGDAYNWRNIDVVSGNNLASGIAIADENGLITVDSLMVSETGNRLIITCNGGCSAVVAGRQSKDMDDALSVSPNPFNPVVKITLSNNKLTVNNGALAVYSVDGKIVHRQIANNEQFLTGIFWNAAGFPSGIYMVCLKIGNKNYNTTVMLLK
ncbi:MAG: hypothetical protein A2268_06390 [Candidatus Raymondbacteria bacterium RifOxyA12_full_50_37]|uniref:Secretion system C-terminal sorting domain-containing protein n=1 Tax=Candidatus Raymondbacteria bacterium RIFOXYD12_FULL_49_13 TaxID=1817890 RepID=A0A1F7FEJ9_UNCRA|nr:MAG: hypothetical protein A2350_21710 [Candidatus Raymondbacteria bacterium RifOxyB12_full_50_8]OGJ92156.1 MAG: hypothetical protein A2268_06390 [Candidatus Raymondbacteria bacterium RifOxyA12_full_50_37]OGJ94440.1 MAG: hypothetical protein A2248_15320 [Candidatus Raymondbacteria bacterium RIFOXYA2_FULL_49_16]OGJ99196.1 MAG: hypothetical protein A2453_07170 [Candidatus Raymondbacteria bacterium RIFOXYC2_FULL_50_21]OGK05120.1 MAG: hypothetical protein A2519_13410 [Candidatus Raymondbacteria b